MVACACKLSILRSEAVKLLAPGSRPVWAKTQFQKHIQMQSMLQRVSREKNCKLSLKNLYPQRKKILQENEKTQLKTKLETANATYRWPMNT